MENTIWGLGLRLSFCKRRTEGKIKWTLYILRFIVWGVGLKVCHLNNGKSDEKRHAKGRGNCFTGSYMTHGPGSRVSGG